MIRIVLDDRERLVEEDATILEACRAHGVDVPTLCHLDGVSPAGSCRVCLVEVRGLPRPVPACATPVWPGMEVTTTSEELRAHRRGTVEMLFAQGHHVCAFCPASGECELQELARSVGLDHVAARVARASAPPIDASHPRFALDPGRCILCARCVRVCAELERAGTLFVVGRGHRAHVVTDGGGGWARSPSCTSCGRCVEACPTGAMFEKAGAQARRPARRARPRAPEARLATVQLGGCAGCHMSLLDLDEELLRLASRVALVASPLAASAELPADVEVCLVEGACSTEDDVRRLRSARERARVLVALGDCACCGNVPAMRDDRRDRALSAGWGATVRDPSLPALLDRVLPLEEVVAVDRFLPGCPPDPGEILDALRMAAPRAAPGDRRSRGFG